MSGYLRQLQRSLSFIEAHLGEELRIQAIARHAGMSMWHFQRIFSAALGQPVMDYVRRRRLSRALEVLTGTSQPLIDIALDHGFGSQEAFTRAFKDMFGVTPGVCRRKRDLFLLPQTVPELTAEYLFHLHQRLTMTPRIEELPPRLVVGIERPFISALSPKRNNHLVIPQLWQDFGPHIGSISNRVGQLVFGCVFCDEGTEAQCRYLACVEVSSVAEVPKGMVRRELSGGKHAVFTHKGSMSRIDRTLGYVYGSWLPRSGERLRSAPEVEIYGDKFDPESPESEMEFCLPIQ
jgi:AraC family transcriptional regulator